jgi:hypothetical protein
MAAIVRRIAIIVLLALLVGIWIYKTQGQGEPPEPSKTDPKSTQEAPAPAVEYSEEELKKMLRETVTKIWEAKMNKRWEVVYELKHPAFRKQTTLVQYMQGKDQFYYENWQLTDVQVEGNKGSASFIFDWGVHLPMKLDVGEAKKRGVPATELYEFDAEAKAWWPCLDQPGSK